MPGNWPSMNICHVVEALMLMPPEELAPILERCKQLLPEDSDEGEWEYSSAREYNRDAPIVVFPFYSAPKVLQEKSENGGDEDWIAVLPDYMERSDVDWLESGTRFGRCDSLWARGPNGEALVIGCHA